MALRTWIVSACFVATLACLPSLNAAGKNGTAPKPETANTALTENGEMLAARYAEDLGRLKTAIDSALPKLDEQLKETLVNAYRQETAAAMGELDKLRAKRPIRNKTPDAKEAAQKAYDVAVKARAKAIETSRKIAAPLLKQLAEVLTGDRLDPQLVKYAVMAEATPRGLAEFAQLGEAQAALIDGLLENADLMKQMLSAGGARNGRYGEAATIYADILKSSPKAESECLQRLALAISLEHAVPIAQRNALDDVDAPTTIDPVKRYLHYEKAYLAGELDPCFDTLDVWEYRYVVNGDEPEHTLAWGREMLRNYRPDIVATMDYRWRYSKIVKTDVRYGSKDQKNDSKSLQYYQNIINTGGICGRRAFFGRFILRCFGMPTLPRPQPGHATLVRWTPDGWVINFGATWGWGRIDGVSDHNFLEMTQARRINSEYDEVLRAQWLGIVHGEKKAYGLHSEASGFWYGLGFYRQRDIVEHSKAAALAAVGTDIGEANETKEKDVVETVTIDEKDKEVAIADNGVITIPAVAYRSDNNESGKILAMKCNLGGYQIHYNRTGGPDIPFDYTVDVPQAGTYSLRARVVTVSPDQHLFVTVNDAKEPVDITAPYTVGMWKNTEPVQIALAKGKTVLRIERNKEGKGMTIKDFTLTPQAKGAEKR